MKFLFIAMAFLGYEALVIATPWLPPFMSIIGWTLVFTILAALGYFLLGYGTRSWYSIVVALVPLIVLFGMDFDGPFAGFSDPEYTVMPMKEVWIWLTAIIFIPAVSTGVLVAKNNFARRSWLAQQ